jgi:phage shock protein E
MDLTSYQSYLFPVALLSFFAWRILKFKKVKALLPKLIAQGAVVVDVRSRAEFQQGSRPGSLNIPLNEVASRLSELDKNVPVILCCASGSRSGLAKVIFLKNGFANVVNAGPWTNTLG